MADTSLLARLFQEKKYSSCADAARGLLAQPDLTSAEKATCYTYLCRSQFQLQEYGACIESGIRAAHLAEEIGDTRPYMMALLNVGGAQFHKGMLEEAAETYRRCLSAKGKPRPDIDNLEGFALTSLGSTLQALGRNEEAVQVLERGPASSGSGWTRHRPSALDAMRSGLTWIWATRRVSNACCPSVTSTWLNTQRTSTPR